MLHAELARGHASAYVPEDGGRRHALLLEQVIRESERRSEILAAMGGAVLRGIGDCFEGEV